MHALAKKTLLTLALLAGLATFAYAQGIGLPTLVTQSPTRYDATVKFATSASTGATITLSPAASNYIYITMIEITDCAGTTVTAAAPTTVTSTGLGGGTTPVWTIGSTGTAGMCDPAIGYWGGIPLKSNAPGTNVTFVLPTFVTQQTVRVNVWYYEAP